MLGQSLASPVQLFISFSFLLKPLSSFRLTFRSIGVLYRTLSSHFPDYGLTQQGIFFFSAITSLWSEFISSEKDAILIDIP